MTTRHAAGTAPATQPKESRMFRTVRQRVAAAVTTVLLALAGVGLSVGTAAPAAAILPGGVIYNVGTTTFSVCKALASPTSCRAGYAVSLRPGQSTKTLGIKDADGFYIGSRCTGYVAALSLRSGWMKVSNGSTTYARVVCW